MNIAETKEFALSHDMQFVEKDTHYECWFKVDYLFEAVWVFNMRCDGAYVGRIMTDGAYRDMLADMENCKTDYPAGYFAHIYDYGYNYGTLNESPVHLCDMYRNNYHTAPLKAMNMLGDCNATPLFMLVEYRDELPAHEYGVSDTYELVGTYDNVVQVEQELEKVHQEVVECSERKVDIIVIHLGVTYKRGERPVLGSSFYIE